MTPQDIIRTALRWAWDQDFLTQAQAEQGLDWIDEHGNDGRLADTRDDDVQLSDLPDRQIDY